MDIRTYYKWKRKKSTMEKINALIESVRSMERNRADAREARIYGRSDADYYSGEAEHMRERARLMYGLIEMEVQNDGSSGRKNANERENLLHSQYVS